MKLPLVASLLVMLYGGSITTTTVAASLLRRGDMERELQVVEEERRVDSVADAGWWYGADHGKNQVGG